MDKLKNMEEKNSNLESTLPESKQGSGSMLSAARKAQNKSIEEIAEELNLSVTQIKTIELDQTEGLPEPTYVRGYIRSYAKLLGLKPESVLHNYLNPDWQKTSSLNDIPRGIGNADESSPGFFTPAKLLALLAVAIIVSFLWYSGMLDGLLGNSATSTTAPTTATPVAEQANSPSSSGGDDVSSTTPSAADGSAAFAEPVPSAAQNTLLMTFSETSWVDIRDADDTRLAYKSYAQGEQLKVENEGLMKVFIGNAAGVVVTLNGAPFDLADHREGVYARFEVSAPVPETVVETDAETETAVDENN